MKDNLNIDKLFKDKFESFEPVVNPKVWQGIASGVATAGTVTASGITWLKSLLIGAVATTVGVGVWFYFDRAAEADNQTAVLDNIVVKTAENQKDDQIFSESVGDNSVNTIESIVNNIKESQEIVEEPEIESKPIVNTVIASSTAHTNSDIVEDKSENLNNAEYVEADARIAEVINDNSKTSAVEKQSANAENSEGNTVVSNGAAEVVESEDTEGKLTGAEETSNAPSELVENKISNKAVITSIPNTFTPSYDGANDEYYIPAENMQNIASFLIVIYSKQQMKLFESTDPNFRWNGYDFGDNMVAKGDCYYIVKAIGQDGETISRMGTISVQY
ncbi:MAG: gliding motility-associated C-terminal domain-containing protein [Crocinitomicaceae bacterium]